MRACEAIGPDSPEYQTRLTAPDPPCGTRTDSVELSAAQRLHARRWYRGRLLAWPSCPRQWPPTAEPAVTVLAVTDADRLNRTPGEDSPVVNWKIPKSRGHRRRGRLSPIRVRP